MKGRRWVLLGRGSRLGSAFEERELVRLGGRERVGWSLQHQRVGEERAVPLGWVLSN